MAVFYRYDYIEILKNIHPCSVHSRRLKLCQAILSVCHVIVSVESRSKALGIAQPQPHKQDYPPPRGRVLNLSFQIPKFCPRSSSIPPAGCFIAQVSWRPCTLKLTRCPTQTQNVYQCEPFIIFSQNTPAIKLNPYRAN